MICLFAVNLLFETKNMLIADFLRRHIPIENLRLADYTKVNNAVLAYIGKVFVQPWHLFVEGLYSKQRLQANMPYAQLHSVATVFRAIVNMAEATEGAVAPPPPKKKPTMCYLYRSNGIFHNFFSVKVLPKDGIIFDYDNREIRRMLFYSDDELTEQENEIIAKEKKKLLNPRKMVLPAPDPANPRGMVLPAPDPANTYMQPPVQPGVQRKRKCSTTGRPTSTPRRTPSAAAGSAPRAREDVGATRMDEVHANVSNTSHPSVNEEGNEDDDKSDVECIVSDSEEVREVKKVVI